MTNQRRVTRFRACIIFMLKSVEYAYAVASVTFVYSNCCYTNETLEDSPWSLSDSSLHEWQYQQAPCRLHRTRASVPVRCVNSTNLSTHESDKIWWREMGSLKPRQLTSSLTHTHPACDNRHFSNYCPPHFPFSPPAPLRTPTQEQIPKNDTHHGERRSR